MKKLLLCGAAALTLAACGGSGGNSEEEINAALTQMSLIESGVGRVAFDDKAIKGDTVTFSDVVLTVENDEDKPTIDAEKLSFKGLTTNDAGDSVFDAVTVSGLSVKPDAEIDDGELTLDNMSLEGPSTELAAWVSGLLGQSEPSAPPAVEDITFEAFSLKDFNFRSEDENVDFGLASIDIDDFTDTKLGKFNLSDFELNFEEDGEEGKLKLGDISIDGLNAEFLKALDAGDEDAILAEMTQIAYGNPLDPGFDKFSLSDVDFDMSGVSFDLPKMSYNVQRDKDGVPVKFSLPEMTMNLSADEEGNLGAQLAGGLAMLGLEEVNFKAASESTYDPATDMAETTKSYLEIADAFKLSNTGTIGGMSKMAETMKAMDMDELAMGGGDPAQVMMQLYGDLEFHDFTLSLEDNGIVDKAISIAAAQQGADPEQLKQQVTGMVAGLPMMAAATGVDAEIFVDLSTAVQTFITDGGTLTIDFSPETAFTLPELMADPSAITKDKLGFSAETK